MANQEKNTSGSREQFDQQALEHARLTQQEALRTRLEHERTHEGERSVESARAEALEQAATSEKESHPRQAPENHEQKRTITKKDKEQSFNTTMREVRSQLSPTSRTFSKVIHQPAVEKASEVLGSTVARPNAILSGSLCAFLVTATFYIIARFNGYPLSGTEAIASFVAGWLLGLLVDYVRFLVVGKK